MRFRLIRLAKYPTFALKARATRLIPLLPIVSIFLKNITRSISIYNVNICSDLLCMFFSAIEVRTYFFSVVVGVLLTPVVPNNQRGNVRVIFSV